jgi:hypothetical protein
MLVALMLSTWVLVLLGMFDLFSLMASLIGLTVARSVIANRLSPMALGRAAWRRLVIAFLDLLDSVKLLGEKTRSLPSRTRAWVIATTPRGPDLAWSVSFGAVIIGAGVLRLIDALAHPSPALGDEYLQRITGVVAIGRRTLPANDLYGVDLLLGAFSRLVTVDPTMLVHLAPAVIGSLLVTTIIACLRRWKVSRGPTLIAAVAVGLAGVASWLPPLGGVDPFGIEVAMAIGVPALVFASEAIVGLTGGRSERQRLAAAAIGLAVFFHPAAGMAMLVGVCLGVLVSWSMSQRDPTPSVRLVVWSIIGAVGGLIPTGVVAWTRGDVSAPFRTMLAEIGVHSTSAVDAVARSGPLPTWPAFVLAGAALLLLLAPELPEFLHRQPDADPLPANDPRDHTRVAQRLVATCTLAFAACVVPDRFGLPIVFRPSDALRVLIPVGGLVVAFALDEILRMVTASRERSSGAGLPRWAEFATASVTVFALFGSSLPMRFNSGESRIQPDAVANALFEIKTTFPSNTWTVVADQDSLPQVAGKGFYLPIGSFTDTYRPETWRFDPRQPELAVPSRHTFIILVPPDSGDTAPDPRPALEAWVKRYGASHKDLSLFSNEDGIEVWHIDRPPSEDKKIMDEIAKEERAARTAGPARPTSSVPVSSVAVSSVAGG